MPIRLFEARESRGSNLDPEHFEAFGSTNTGAKPKTPDRMSIGKAERNAISRTAIGFSIGSVFAQTDSPRGVAAKNAVANQEKRIDEFELRKDDPEFAGGAIPSSKTC